VFSGEYPCKLDDKGRFILPTPLREQFESESPEESKTAMLIKGQEKCLWMYTTEHWKTVLQRTKERLDEDQSRLFMHFVVSESMESELDRAGRMLIPKRLRDFANLDREVVLLGMYERIEIWSTEGWNEYLSRVEEKFETTLSKFLNIL